MISGLVDLENQRVHRDNRSRAAGSRSTPDASCALWVHRLSRIVATGAGCLARVDVTVQPLQLNKSSYATTVCAFGTSQGIMEQCPRTRSNLERAGKNSRTSS